MSVLEQIERSVLELSPEELKTFTEWLEAIQERNFDAAIEQDAKGGRLDAFANKALAEFDSGSTRAL